MTDLQEHLAMQKTFLSNSIELFDRCEIEAIRLATTIRVLVHDTKHSTSLLQRLGQKEQVGYVDTAYEPNVFAGFNISGVAVEVEHNEFIANTPYAGLVAKEICSHHLGASMYFKPRFQHSLPKTAYPQLDFASWWGATIFDNKNGMTLSRRELVCWAANKDGGAHIDEKLPAGYESMKQAKQIRILVDGKTQDFQNVPLYASICQVGWELRKSVDGL